MTHLGYVLGGYLLTAAVLGVYVLRLWSRSRALARVVGAPPGGGTPVPPGPPPSTGDPLG